MMDFLFAPWPWYVSGPLIASVMFLLLYQGKSFGMSSNLRTMCAIGGAGKWADFFRFDWKSVRWNLAVAFGALVGGFIAAYGLSGTDDVELAAASVASLEKLGIGAPGASYLPQELFSVDALGEWQTWPILILGGLLIGFGARYAGGCTSGHAISGLSNLQIPSLIAVIGFFIGGLTMTWLLFPLIFAL